MTVDHIERLREGYESFNRGDIEAVAAALDLDIKLEERPDSPDPVTARGRLSGIPIDGEIVHAWRFDGDRVTGLRAFSTVEEALTAVRAG